MEEAVRRGVHSVLVIAKVRQTPLDESGELRQGLGPVPRPRELLRARRSHRAHARGLDLNPEGAVVVAHVPRLRRRGVPFQGLRFSLS